MRWLQRGPLEGREDDLLGRQGRKEKVRLLVAELMGQFGS